MAQAIPVTFFVRLTLVFQRCQFAIAHEEQIAEHFDFGALLTFTEQRSDVDA
ncbi:hypothetical protein D3C76_1884260 [compost metagenome]